MKIRMDRTMYAVGKRTISYEEAEVIIDRRIAERKAEIAAEGKRKGKK